MKAALLKPLVISTALGLWLGTHPTTFAQTSAKPDNLVDLKDPTIQVQQTPDWDVKNIQKKRWKPKDWIEIEVPFEAKAPANKRDLKVYDSLNFKYYVYLDSPDKDKKKILTADVTHVNIPIGETMASVVYLSPSDIFSLTGSNRAMPNMVTMWGIEVFNGTQLVGFHSSRGKSPTQAGAEWWKVNNAPPQVPGLLRNKTQTPFAPLWGDYHAEVQATH
jgi:hypothetical protein